MKTGKKLGVWLLLCSLIVTGLLFPGEKVYAAPTANFSVSGGNASLGSTVSVTVSVNGSENMAFAQVSLNYSANILEYQSGADSGGSGRVNLLFDCGSGQKSASRTITFKAVAAGKASLSLDAAKATPMDANSGDWMNASVAGSASVTVGEAKNLSGDAHIASIEVSPGTLKPAFNTEVFKYTMEVENNVTSIAVTAKASHQAAKITAVNGASDLKVGANKVTVICTAENGGTAAYTITVTRKAAGGEEKPQPTTKPQEEPTTAPSEAETPEMTCELNGAVYYVGQNFPEKSVPTDFSVAEIQYQNQTIKGAQFNNNNEIQLIYLLNSEKKDGKFYMYYPASGLISELVQLSFYEGNYIYLLDPLAYGITIPIDVVGTTFQMDDRELPGYVLAKPKAGVGQPLEEGTTDVKLENVSTGPEQFVFLYGLSKDGSVSWHTYDKQEKTLQRLVVFASEEEKEEEAVETVSDGSENAVKKMLTTLKAYRIILLGAGAIIVLLIVLCVLIAVNAKRKAAEDEEDDYEMIYKSFGEEEEASRKQKNREKSEKETEAGKKEAAEAKQEIKAAKREAAEAKREIKATKKEAADAVNEGKAVKQEALEATKEMPAREIRKKAESSVQKAEQKPAAAPEKKPAESAAQKTEKKPMRKPDEKPLKKPVSRPEDKPAKKQEEDDLGLEIFDIDDL